MIFRPPAALGTKILFLPTGLEKGKTAISMPRGVVFPCPGGWGKNSLRFSTEHFSLEYIFFFFLMEFLADAAHLLLEYGKLPDHLPDEEAARVVHFYGC